MDILLACFAFLKEQLGKPVAAWLCRLVRTDAIVSWAVTFGAAYKSVVWLGFGLSGIVKGSLAASFQSFLYGGLTPAGGIFAKLTSMGMLGTLGPFGVIAGSVAATAASAAVWASGGAGYVEHTCSWLYNATRAAGGQGH